MLTAKDLIAVEGLSDREGDRRLLQQLSGLAVEEMTDDEVRMWQVRLVHELTKSPWPMFGRTHDGGLAMIYEGEEWLFASCKAIGRLGLGKTSSSSQVIAGLSGRAVEEVTSLPASVYLALVRKMLELMREIEQEEETDHALGQRNDR